MFCHCGHVLSDHYSPMYLPQKCNKCDCEQFKDIQKEKKLKITEACDWGEHTYCEATAYYECSCSHHHFTRDFTPMKIIDIRVLG